MKKSFPAAPPTEVPKKYLRIAQFSAKTGLAKSTIYLKISQGQLPPPLKLGKCSLWDESAVEAAIEGGAK